MADIARKEIPPAVESCVDDLAKGIAAKKAGLRLKRGVSVVQRLDASAVVLHDSHALVSNLWGAFDRVKRNLSGLRLHRLCRGVPPPG